MNYNHLHYFYIVVREGTISAASRYLHISQPSLSSQIKTFEENIGVPLFDRTGNKLKLTPAGRSVYEQASKMFEASALISEMIDKSSKEAPTIKIGIADEIERPFAVSMAKSLFAKWKRKEPPAISFTTGYSEDLLSKTRGWSVDALITNRPTSLDDLEIAGTLVMPVVFVTADNIDGIKSNAVSCSAHEIYKLIPALKRDFSAPSERLKLREEIDMFLAKEKLSRRISFESDTLAMVVRSIIDNVGVGFIPLPYISREVVRKEVVVFGSPEGLWHHTLFLITKKGRKTSPGVFEAIQAFDDLKNDFNKTLGGITFQEAPKLFGKL